MSRHHMLRRAIGVVALLCVVGQASPQKWLRWDESRPSRDEDPAKILSVQPPVRTNPLAKTPAVPVVAQPATMPVPVSARVAVFSTHPAAVTVVEPIPQQTPKVEAFVAANAIPVPALTPVSATATAHAVEPIVAAIAVPALAPAKTPSIEAVVAAPSPEADVVKDPVVVDPVVVNLAVVDLTVVNPLVAISVVAESIAVMPPAARLITKPVVSRHPAVARVTVIAKPLVAEQQPLAALAVASEEQPVGDADGFVAANAIAPAALAPISAVTPGSDSSVVPPSAPK